MAVFNSAQQAALAQIKSFLGPAGWREPQQSSAQLEDPRGRFTGLASLIVLPDSTEQVTQVVACCHQANIALVPHSGGTGVVAGQLSIDNDAVIILSLKRMNRVRQLLREDAAIVVEAGCILESVHEQAAQAGFQFPLSMASKGSCCIGGNLATNAGGIQVLRHGNARDLCLGIEAVLPDGSLLSELSPLRKNNTGYDLRHLLIGSEGTLGVITAATLALKPVEAETAVCFCALESPQHAVALLHLFRRQLGENVSAIELMCGLGIELVNRHFPNLRSPFKQGHDWYLLLEVAGQAGVGQQLERVLLGSLEQNQIADAVLASSQTQAQALWQLRENTPEANRLEGAICSSDTSVPISQIDQFIHTTYLALRDIDPDLRVNSYGHIGDGNIHHNVFPPAGTTKQHYLEAHPGIIDTVRMAINESTHQCSGSISAEHGIGRLKTEDLQHYQSPAKMSLMRAIKQAIDPHNIMNPGALL
ncbi:MAG: FAD-binding oxidoreductase [Granulosicoccaceae bacterium]